MKLNIILHWEFECVFSPPSFSQISAIFLGVAFLTRGKYPPQRPLNFLVWMISRLALKFVEF